MKEARKLWTRDELILALNLYLKLPYGKMHARTPEVIYLANLVGRTPDSIAIRLVNFAAVDPFHQRRGVVGMRGGIKQVKPIWDEFINNKESATDSLLLYKVINVTDNNIDKQELLGRIKSNSTQEFRLRFFDLRVTNNKFDYRDKFLLYDIMKKQVVDSINFNR